MASTRSAASSSLSSSLKSGKTSSYDDTIKKGQTSSYDDTIKKMLFEKQHIFMQTLLLGMTYDELDQCEIATETSSTVCTEEVEDDEYDSELDDEDVSDDEDSDEEDSDEEDSGEDDDEEDDEDDESSVDEDELAAFEQLASEHAGRYARRFSVEPLQDSSLEHEEDKVSDPASTVEVKRRASSIVRFDPNIVVVEQEQEDCSQLPVDVLDDQCPALNLLSIVEGSDDRYIPSSSVECYFVEHSIEQIEAYDSKLIQTIRRNDLQELRRMHEEEGHQLQASNQFGETVIHIASRRGSLDILKYMVEEAGVTIRVRDDYGRTPMHDCCWTAEPNVELMAYLVNLEPDMLFMMDAKGYTPLEYARCQHRSAWNQFLMDIRDVVTSRCRIGRLKCSI